MYYKKIFVLSTVLFFFNYFVSAQKLHVKLNWGDIIVVESKEESYKLLNFSDAEYLRSIPCAPSYTKVLELGNQSGYTSYDAQLINVKTAFCSPEEEKLISKKDGLTREFQVSTNVQIARGKRQLSLQVNPFRYTQNNRIEKLLEFDIVYTGVGNKQNSFKAAKQFADNSVLSTGSWVRVPISKTGLYKLSYSDLSSMGLANAENVRVFGNDIGLLSMRVNNTDPDDLSENNILKTDDGIVFYAKAADKWVYDLDDEKYNHINHFYSDVSYYYFSSDYNSSMNNNIEHTESLNVTPDYTVNTFNDFKVIDEDRVNLAKTGRIFYGDVFDIELTKTYDFAFPNLVSGQDAQIIVDVAAASTSYSYFSVEAEGTTESIGISPYGDHSSARTGSVDFNVSPQQAHQISVTLSYQQSFPSWRGWLNYIEVNAVRALKWDGGQMRFSNTAAYGSGTYTEYIISDAQENLSVWDITDPVHPKIVEAEYSSGTLRFTVATNELKEFVVFETNNYYSPDPSEATLVENQNLHATDPDIDMIIVTHPLFYSQAEELKLLREEQDNLNVFITTPEKIYNEFSSGAKDISAIRNFVRMLYEKASEPEDALKYLLLFGDASYNNKDDFEGNTNYILCYQNKISTGQDASYFSDDFFGLLDIEEGDVGISLVGKLDIGVGRLPVSNTSQANALIQKYKDYENSKYFGPWRNRLVFVADDENSNAHIRDADTLAINTDRNYPWFNIRKIYMDAYRQITVAGGERYPEVNTDITAEVLKGTLLVNYTGHGGVKGWAHERVLTISEIENWSNAPKYPLFITATCEFSRFDDYSFLSAGERVLLNPKGGAIAMFTTARIAYIGSNARLTKQLYASLFENDESGEQVRMGDIIRLTKNQLSDNKNLIFFLLGDPSMKLGYAEHFIATTSVNEQPIEEFNDTINALSKVSFSGQVQNRNGTLLEEFSGSVFPVVYDKKQEVTTLNNDGDGVWTYEERKNILFRGEATVNSGEFSFEFIVPRDILLNVDTGKISYYGMADKQTAKGAFSDFLVGGVSDDYPADNTGPVINLYMNDENFVPGGITTSEPVLLAKFSDESGINTSSGAIGHDITAVFDDETSKVISLNQDYIADKDTYKSGKAEHFLFDIEEGNHQLTVKAWDVYNNSSEKVLDFTVVNADDIQLKHLLNYPNPFTTSTNFYFEHNRAYEQIEVMIQIFTISGKLVKTIYEQTQAQGYRAGPYHWNGRDDFGQKIGRGTYIYKVKIRTSDGTVKEKYQKLLILK
ncbi:MAG: type IX secretion system sortase PorU [Bacteroidota bacterium]|nr:type IX secretion system sortase PorU [Bacteroidota bacterium]